MKFIIVLTLVFGLFLVGNWLFMLLLGAGGHIFNMPTLAVSFWQTCIVCLLLSFVGSFFRSSK